MTQIFQVSSKTKMAATTAKVKKASFSESEMLRCSSPPATHHQRDSVFSISGCPSCLCWHKIFQLYHQSSPCETQLFIPTHLESQGKEWMVFRVWGNTFAEAWWKRTGKWHLGFYWCYTQKIQTWNSLLLLTPAWHHNLTNLKTTKSREPDGSY